MDYKYRRSDGVEMYLGTYQPRSPEDLKAFDNYMNQAISTLSDASPPIKTDIIHKNNRISWIFNSTNMEFSMKPMIIYQSIEELFVMTDEIKAFLHAVWCLPLWYEVRLNSRIIKLYFNYHADLNLVLHAMYKDILLPEIFRIITTFWNRNYTFPIELFERLGPILLECFYIQYTQDDIICAICQRNIDFSEYILPCGHSYHSKCIMQWYTTYEDENHIRCPTCRQEYSMPLPMMEDA